VKSQVKLAPQPDKKFWPTLFYRQKKRDTIDEKRKIHMNDMPFLKRGKVKE
jgi:hypothetical protein